MAKKSLRQCKKDGKARWFHREGSCTSQEGSKKIRCSCSVETREIGKGLKSNTA